MNTLNAKTRVQRAICATFACVVTVFAIAVSTLASRPYILPGQAPYSAGIVAGHFIDIA